MDARTFYTDSFDISRLPLDWDRISQEDIAELQRVINSTTLTDFIEDDKKAAEAVAAAHDDCSLDTKASAATPEQ